MKALNERCKRLIKAYLAKQGRHVTFYEEREPYLLSARTAIIGLRFDMVNGLLTRRVG